MSSRDKEYDIEYFRENRFIRKKCPKCNFFFWSRDEKRETCDDAPCNTYSFIGSPVFKERSMEEMRETFFSFFEKLPYKHERIERYPVVARWRYDIYLNIASISNFQPFITSGKVPPPANPLVISQPCIRLEDLESIGRSGRHLTIFEMMAHHAFNSPLKEIYWKNATVEYCDEFLEELGVDAYKVVYKEAPWVGGGNAGPCLEVITKGLELATLVFMDLELSPFGNITIKGQRYKKMENYIVDTGYGLERFVWASKGTPTIYEAIFPEVIESLVNISGGDINKKKHFSPEIYAIADHAKCLAFMLADGVVPSNAKEGYLARLILRRALRMLKSQNLEKKIPLEEIVIMHIKSLRSSFPELQSSVNRIVEILSLEEERYENTLLKGERIVKQVVKEYKERRQQKITLDKMINLYDTYGIPPEFAKEVASKIDANLELEIPENFYSYIASMHSEEKRDFLDRGREEGEKERDGVKGIRKTIKMYYEEPLSTDFRALVLDAFNGFIVLDKTLFYPEGGGQPADTGFLISKRETLKVVDVKDVEGIILHKTEEKGKIEKRAVVKGSVDLSRRFALSRHHSATHVILWAARKILGEHVWQAGAQKGERRSRLDITHFQRISGEERKEIEMIANKMVMRNEKIIAGIEERNEAEKEYGFRIYQGGLPGSKEIRIVKIGEGKEVEDVQACAGTHCSRTGEIGSIKIIRTERVQDGIERIEFSAGEAAVLEMQERDDMISKSASTLKVPYERLPATVDRFFEEWKQLKKENERLRGSIADLRKEILEKHARVIEGVKVIAEILHDADRKELTRMAALLSEKNFVTVLIGAKGKNAYVVSSVPSYLKDVINAEVVVKNTCEMFGGGGSCNATISQGGFGFEGMDKVEKAKEIGVKLVEEMIKSIQKV